MTSPGYPTSISYSTCSKQNSGSTPALPPISPAGSSSRWICCLSERHYQPPLGFAKLGTGCGHPLSFPSSCHPHRKSPSTSNSTSFMCSHSFPPSSANHGHCHSPGPQGVGLHLLPAVASQPPLSFPPTNLQPSFRKSTHQTPQIPRLSSN